MRLEISELARADLLVLHEQSLRNFGSPQTRVFFAGLTNTLKILARFPAIARERTEFDPPVRVHPHKSLVIIYRTQGDNGADQSRGSREAESERPLMKHALFRAPEMRDIPEAASVHVRCWQEAYANIMDAEFLRTLSAEQRAEGWKRSLGDASVFKLLATTDNRIAGFVFSGQTREIDGVDGEVYAINVLAAHYRKGIGTALFNAAREDWKARGGKSVGLFVIKANARARTLYDALGGEVIGERTCTIGNENHVECIYRFTS